MVSWMSLSCQNILKQIHQLILAQSQPILMQYVSANGMPQQAGVQYIQLLRPVMMVPAQQYNPPKHYEEPEMESDFVPSSPSTLPPTTSVVTMPHRHSLANPYGPYSRQPPHSTYTSPLTSYKPRPMPSQRPLQSHLPSHFDLGLNLNEYMPSATSQLSAILAPRSSVSSMISPYAAYKPAKYQQLAQRA